MSAFHRTLAYMSAFHVMAFYTIKKGSGLFSVVVFEFLAKKLPNITYRGGRMSFGSWRLVGVKMATNDLFFTTMGFYPLFAGSHARCSVGIITSSPPHWGITLQVPIMTPCQAFRNWGGVAATIEVGFRLPKSDAMVRCIGISVKYSRLD